MTWAITAALNYCTLL